MSWNQGHLLKSGQYEVIRLLGSGGFGMTYLAKDLHLERQVVIKRPNLSFEADRDYDKFLRRFKREAQVLAQVQIPNIVRVIEFIEIEGMPCLVMDFVAGETLNECIRRRQFIPEDEALQLFQKLAIAVENLHQQGIIHCDIHPGNIIVQPNSEPMLIDFGSTKLLHPTTWTVTTTVNKDFGPYEQMAESDDNILGSQPTWDIYSLAANMYFAVTGQKPMPAISRKLYGDGLKSPKELKPELSDELNRVILQGMALEMKNRPNILDFGVNQVYDFEPMLTGLFIANKNQQRRAKIAKRLREIRKKSQQQIAEKNDLPALDITPINPTPEYDFQKSASSRVQSFVTILHEESKSSVPTKKLKMYFPYIDISFLVLGYFWNGAILGVHFENTVFIFALSAIFGLAFAKSAAWDNLLLATFALNSLFRLAWGWNSGRYWLWFWCWDWVANAALLVGYVDFKKEWRKNYSNVQILWIHFTFSSIGLIFGGILGSWLKAAGILKLP